MTNPFTGRFLKDDLPVAPRRGLTIRGMTKAGRDWLESMFAPHGSRVHSASTTAYYPESADSDFSKNGFFFANFPNNVVCTDIPFTDFATLKSRMFGRLASRTFHFNSQAFNNDLHILQA